MGCSVVASGVRRLIAGLIGTAVVLCVGSCSSPSKTEENPNKTIAAGAFLYVFVDDHLDSLYVNGVAEPLVYDTVMNKSGGILKVPFGPYTGTTVTLGMVGSNTGLWSGELMAALVTGDGKYYATDASWKCSFAPEAGWNATGFNDAGWNAVGDYGLVDSTAYWSSADVDGNFKWRALQDSCPVRVFKPASARAVWSPKKTYFRKTFTSATAKTAIMKLAAEGGQFTAYLNGTQVAIGSGTAISMDSIPVNLVAGTNVLAAMVVDTAVNENGVGIKFGGAIVSDSAWIDEVILFNEFNLADPFNPTHEDSINPLNWDTTRTTEYVYKTHTKSDTSWHFTVKEEAGWTGTSYVENSSWKSSDVYGGKFGLPLAGGQKSAATKPLCTWVWSPKKAYFRKEFTLK